MNNKRVVIMLCIVMMILGSVFVLTGASKTEKWDTAYDVQIRIDGSTLNGEAKYRWISDTMIEVKYTKGHTWIVNEENVLIRTTNQTNGK